MSRSFGDITPNYFMQKSLLTLAFASALTLAAQGDMIVRNYQPLRHDRFYSGLDKAFVGDPYNFSGVGFDSATSTWATLISDCYFISATHFHPGTGEAVTFRETNSLSDPSHTYTVAGGQQINGTDLWVGWLNSAVDPSIARYSVLDLPTTANYVGLELYNYGLTNRVGRNVSDFFASQTVGPSTGDTMFYDYDNLDVPSVGGDETFIQVGDSGAPSFTVFGGKLTALGVHWAITDIFPGTNEGEYSLDTFVPSYIADLNVVLADKNQSVSVVPEPASITLLICVASGLLAGRRRRA